MPDYTFPHAPLGPPAELQAPPSPRTHRTLRRLQSAHALGAKAASQSLITQQRLREQHHQLQQIQLHPPHPAPRNPSPTKRDVSGAGAGAGRGSPQRTRERSNSDVSVGGSGSGARKTGFRKPAAAHTNLPMQTLIRDGPPDGDVVGALEATRYKILDEGIKSDSDGMVSTHLIPGPLALQTVHYTRILTYPSPLSASTSGSSSSTPPSSPQTTTSPSSTAAPPPPTPRSATTPSVP